MRFTDDLKARVSKAQKRIVLPETNSRRVLKAAERVLADGFAKIIRQHMAVWTNYALILQKDVKKRA